MLLTLRRQAVAVMSTSAVFSRWRAARRDIGVSDATDADSDTGAASETASVTPAAEASKAAVRGRLDRRVGAEAAWGFSKGKSDSLGFKTSSSGALTTFTDSGR